ncbi:MAG: hypothetical protein NC489_39025, partial [Ruminococcus flavefaciens]|nr:hypothetical protein [Ruminococcus flavefaciens]
CGQKGEEEKKAELSARPIQQAASETDTIPEPTQASSAEKKTLEEVLESIFYGNTPEEIQKRYDTPELEKVRYNDINEWKDAEGNYHAPKGYKIDYSNPNWFAEEMAAQQMPQELLEEISTEELYQLIMSLPMEGLGWEFIIYDTYLQRAANLYLAYNFMTDFMRREDSPQVVHQYYQKYSEEDRLDYTGNIYVKTRKIIEPTDKEEFQKQQQFQLTEVLEWVFRYQEEDAIPEEEEKAVGVWFYENDEN